MSKKVQIKVAVDVTNATELEALNVFLRAIGQNPTITGNVQNIDRPAKDLKVVDAEVVKPIKEAPKAKAEEVADMQEAEAPDAAETTKSKYSREQVRTATTEKAKINKEAVKATLTKLGANNVTSLDESKFEDFMAAIESIE
jgi:hypothetical protein